MLRACHLSFLPDNNPPMPQYINKLMYRHSVGACVFIMRGGHITKGEAIKKLVLRPANTNCPLRAGPERIRQILPTLNST